MAQVSSVGELYNVSPFRAMHNNTSAGVINRGWRVEIHLTPMWWLTLTLNNDMSALGSIPLGLWNIFKTLHQVFKNSSSLLALNCKIAQANLTDVFRRRIQAHSFI